MKAKAFLGPLAPYFCLFTFCLLIPQAQAQVPAALKDRSDAQLVRDAFAAPYGKLIVAEFGSILRESSDTACLRTSGIDASALESRGGELLQAMGERYLAALLRFYDPAKIEAGFRERGGADAQAEFLRLRQDADIRELSAIVEPGRLGRFVERIAENFDRAVLLWRLGLKRQLSPLNSGNTALFAASPVEKSDDAADRFMDSHDTPAMKRWFELQVALAQTQKAELDRDAMLMAGPMDLMPGLDEALARLCVKPTGDR